MSSHVFFFGQGKSEGDPKRRDILGGKGAGLAEMTVLGLPVPPGFTILPITPPDELADAISAGSSPSELAVTTCRLPNSAFAEVSLPVRNTASHPSIALKNGNSAPVTAKASPSVVVAPL